MPEIVICETFVEVHFDTYFTAAKLSFAVLCIVLNAPLALTVYRSTSFDARFKLYFLTIIVGTLLNALHDLCYMIFEVWAYAERPCLLLSTAEECDWQAVPHNAEFFARNLLFAAIALELLLIALKADRRNKPGFAGILVVCLVILTSVGSIVGKLILKITMDHEHDSEFVICTFNMTVLEDSIALALQLTTLVLFTSTFVYVKEKLTKKDLDLSIKSNLHENAANLHALMSLFLGKILVVSLLIIGDLILHSQNEHMSNWFPMLSEIIIFILQPATFLITNHRIGRAYLRTAGLKSLAEKMETAYMTKHVVPMELYHDAVPNAGVGRA